MGHGALIQLSAVGVEDVDLTVNANHTFWKTTYVKATGYSMEPREVAFTGTAGYGSRKAAVQIIRSGDMLCDMYLMYDIAPFVGDGTNAYVAGDVRFTNDVGRAFIDTVAIDIGGVIYDTKQGEFIHIWEELTVRKELHCNRLTGKSESVADLFDWGKGVQRIYTPISFWFTDDYAQALPLVGLYQHDVRIEFQFKALAALTIPATGVTYINASEIGAGITNLVLVCEYVFLENNERNYFARGSHKYMITQLQYSGLTSVTSSNTTANVTVNFNHPTQELIWVFRDVANVTAPILEYFDFAGLAVDGLVEGDTFLTNRLLLNSSERYAPRDPHYFRQVTTKRVHSRIPNKHIYVYSFALHPEQIEPSGSINFSRIDNTEMRFTRAATTNNVEFHLWARSINWMKIERGMGKLFYA